MIPFFSILLLIKLQNSQTALQLTNPAHTRRRESTEQATTTHTPGHEMPSYHTPEKDQDSKKVKGVVTDSTAQLVGTSTHVGQLQGPKKQKKCWANPETVCVSSFHEDWTTVKDTSRPVEGLKMRFRPNGPVYPVKAYEVSGGRLYLRCSRTHGGDGDFFKYEGVNTIADFKKSRFFVAHHREWSNLR